MALTGSEQVLQLVRIGFSFENRTEAPFEVIRDISLDIERGQFLSLVGPNGCGKTTLLRIVAGLIQPVQGKVMLAGKEIKAAGQGIGLIFQEFALLPWRTVWNNIELGMETKPLSKAQRDEVIGSYIPRLGLDGFEHRFPRELSGGMKQKVAIARALVNEPQVLLMDEPFASLDAQSRNFLQEFLVRLWQQSGKTIIFVTHNVDEAIFLSQRIVIIGRRPAEVRLDMEVDLPYPRDRTCDRFNSIRRHILESLRRETFPEYAKLGYFSEGN